MRLVLSECHDVVRERVRTWLRGKNRELRVALLEVILELRAFDAGEAWRELKKRGFRVDVKSVRAMLGLIPPRLGILVSRGGPGERYFVLREEFAPLVREEVARLRGER